MLQSITNQAGAALRTLVHEVSPDRVPLLPKTEQDFCSLLNARVNAGKLALVAIAVRANYEDTSGGWGFFELRNCELVCEAAVGNRERIIFVRELFTRWRTEGVVRPSDEKQCKTVAFVAAGLQATRIRDQVPRADIHVLAGEGSLSMEKIACIVGNAETYGVTLEQVKRLFPELRRSTDNQEPDLNSLGM